MTLGELCVQLSSYPFCYIGVVGRIDRHQYFMTALQLVLPDYIGSLYRGINRYQKRQE